MAAKFLACHKLMSLKWKYEYIMYSKISIYKAQRKKG